MSTSSVEASFILADGQRRHQAGAAMIVGRLEELHALAPRLDADDAAATLAVVSEIRLALVLRDDYGWSFERIEAWIADMSRRLLLA